MKSLRDGYDVRGMYYWTLMDNIEWHEGFHMKFGLFEWDPAAPANEVRTQKLYCGAQLCCTLAACKPRLSAWCIEPSLHPCWPAATPRCLATLLKQGAALLRCFAALSRRGAAASDINVATRAVASTIILACTDLSPTCCPYAFPPTQEMKLRLRPGSEALREAYRIWPDPLAEMRSFACDKHGWLAAQQLLRGGSGKVTASSPGSASAKIKNAWSDRDLCSKGDQEPPERSVGWGTGMGR